MKIKTCLILFVIMASVSIQAQDFLKPSDRFSSKETSYFVLKDGSSVEGTIDDIDRKKGLIEEIDIYVNGDSKNKRKLKPEDIDHMYLMPSGLDKLGNSMDEFYDLQEHSKDRRVDDEKIKAGYVLFESSRVILKKKERVLLLQLLNPTFSSNIKIYYDPFAKETMSAGIGGFTLAGGDAKSYYCKKGDDIAFKLEKKNYDDHWKDLYESCSSLETTYKKVRWDELNKHILTYNSDCAK